MANPNVANRSDTSFYTGPIGAGTVLTLPVTYADSDGAASALTVPAAATDAATTMALANAIRLNGITLGLWT